MSFPTCRCSWSCMRPAAQDSWVSVFPRTSRQGRWSDACVQSMLSGHWVDMSRTACHSCALEEPVWHKNHNTTLTVQVEASLRSLFFSLSALLTPSFWGFLMMGSEVCWSNFFSGFFQVQTSITPLELDLIMIITMTRSINSDVNVERHCRWQQALTVDSQAVEAGNRGLSSQFYVQNKTRKL